MTIDRSSHALTRHYQKMVLVFGNLQALMQICLIIPTALKYKIVFLSLLSNNHSKFCTKLNTRDSIMNMN
jgi:hypothetical protein